MLTFSYSHIFPCAVHLQQYWAPGKCAGLCLSCLPFCAHLQSCETLHQPRRVGVVVLRALLCRGLQGWHCLHSATKGLGAPVCAGEGHQWAECGQLPLQHSQAADLPPLHARDQLWQGHQARPFQVCPSSALTSTMIGAGATLKSAPSPSIVFFCCGAWNWPWSRYGDVSASSRSLSIVVICAL
jgi:hypothetical protein